jgi:hypothetical protein
MHLKISIILLSVVLLAGMISINTRPAYAAISTCTASLDGSQEVPPIDTEGTGSATMTFDSSSNELSWSIEFSGLSGPANAAHFHGPAAAGTNAGIQVSIGDVSGLTSPMDGSAVLTQEQASSLLDGQMYINIHTALNTGGEIRGQVSCAESQPDAVSEKATLVIGENEFDIRYNITGGTLDELTGDPVRQTLLVTINATSNGTLTIELPTDVIDAEDSEFSVFIDDESGNFIADELEPTADARVLQIEFPAGAEQIEIVGTSMVPEFGAVSAIILAIAVVAVLLTATKYQKFRGFRPI